MNNLTIAAELKQIRQDLHQIPELEFNLFKTHLYVKTKLEAMGYHPRTVAKTGIIAVKEGSLKEAVAFRSDMDALPVAEKSNNPTPSTHIGAMHACGHDGHMAMLLGFAGYVSKLENLKQTIVFIFQPAEEGPGGAKVIINEGIFDEYHITKIFGFHLFPGLKEGLYGLANGPLMAQNGEFDVEIHATSAHGAQPHLGHDAILAASQLINQYHTIVSRSVDPLEPAVVTVGTIGGGEARNIISNYVKFTGTIRAFHEDVYRTIKIKINEMNTGIEQSFQVKVKSVIRDYYPPVLNDANLFHQALTILSPSEYKIIKPLMFAEDFAFYQQKVPGLFIMLGTKNEKKEYIHPLHSCCFNFDESVLVKGVELYIRISKDLGIF
jgi:hippurate hydrolase